MKRKRFSVEQIVAVLKEHELGIPGTELCRRVGVSENTFYRWKKVYGGISVRRGKANTSSTTKVAPRNLPREAPNTHGIANVTGVAAAKRRVRGL